MYKTIRNKNEEDLLQEDLTAAAEWEKDCLMSLHPMLSSPRNNKDKPNILKKRRLYKIFVKL